MVAQGKRLLNGREVNRFYSLSPDQFVTEMVESLEEKDLTPDDFSVRELAESIMGREWVDNLRPKSGRFVSLLEADAVKYSHFSNITGQIFFSAVREGFENEELIFSKIIPDEDSNIFDMEKIPGMSEIGDEAEIVEEAQPYPMVGISEDYIEVAAKKKRGFILPLTKEFIAGDLTGLWNKYARKGGFWLGLNKEKRLIDTVIDENSGAKSAAIGGHRYHWRGSTYATYQTSGPWVNVKTSNGLTDYNNIEAAWLLLADMTDPYTGEPIMVQPKHLIFTPDNAFTASRVLSATEIRTGDITTGTGDQTISGNPIQTIVGTLTPVSSRLLKARAATDTDWWLGNLEEAFCYFKNWDISSEEAPSNSEDAFKRDIVQQFKVSEKGVPATKEPRVVVENRA